MEFNDDELQMIWRALSSYIFTAGMMQVHSFLNNEQDLLQRIEDYNPDIAADYD
jgi:hypothetical protein